MHNNNSPLYYRSLLILSLGSAVVLSCGRGVELTPPETGSPPPSQALTAPTAPPQDGRILPFSGQKTASFAAQTLQNSKMVRRKPLSHLASDAPNILIILIDDVGFGISDTFGGEVHTPTLSHVAQEGIRYNSFHTTSICSPTRASLLTGRNHTRVGSGTIAERAVDWDGYTGVIPKTSATMAEVLKQYGYKTSAFGKWHNSPATQTTTMGPKDNWPNGYGFEYFYGFMAGETSQYEPRLFENYNPVEPARSKSYHLTEDLTEKALTWMGQHRSFSPDKPFFMYWAPGAVHGPHHVAKKWADKYKGKFDSGWDEYRKRVFARQTQLGIIPAGTKLTERDETLASWNSIPQKERAFQTRLMEVFAGFVEHTDNEVGKLLTGMEELGYRDNTIVIYIFGDNGSSAEGQNGTISELLAQNQIPNTIGQQISALKNLGGLDALGGPQTDNMYHAGWAWAGSTPFRSTKLVAAHFGGTRNPMIISWPKRIKPDSKVRSQFLHVNDIAPTLYDVLDIPHPEVVNGFRQDPIDGISFAKTFEDAHASFSKGAQFFDNNGSRGVHLNGWFAGTFGPLYPWISAQKGLKEWDSDEDIWQLYNLDDDFSQADDLALKYPEKLKEMKALFLKEASENKDFPIGAGIWLRIHPEDLQMSPYTSWKFNASTRRMPEFTAPGLGRQSNRVELDVETEDNQSGVLYALGGAGGGLTLYMDKGKLIYEYNLMIIEQFMAKSTMKLKPGAHKIVVTTHIPNNKPGAPATITLEVDGQKVAETKTTRTVPLVFTASETLDIGVDLGSPVSARYFQRAPFAFEGTINEVRVKLLDGN